MQRVVEQELKLNLQKNQDLFQYYINNGTGTKTYERLLKSYHSEEDIQYALVTLNREIRALRKDIENEKRMAKDVNNSNFNSLDFLYEIANYTNIEYLFSLLNDRHDIQYNIVKNVLADIVHTTRNPISGISAVLMILQDQIDDPSILDSLKDIEQYLNQINENMSLYKQISHADDNIIDNTPVDLKHLLENNSRLVILASGKSIKLSFNIHNIELPSNSAKVLLNSFSCILENAVAFVEDNGSIMIEAVLQDGQLDVVIQNDGPIISADILPEIFNNGFSSRHSSGRGLAIAKKYVEEVLNGIIVCENIGDEYGVRFTISIDI